MLNQIVLIGRLTKEPEVRVVGEKETSVVRFSLAVNRPKYGDADAQTDFIPVVAWRGTAEFIGRNFHKGKQVYVVGRLQTKTWDGNDGVRHYGFEVVANEVGFADSVQKQDGQANTKPNSGKSPNGADEVPETDAFSGTDGFPEADVFGGAKGFPDDFADFVGNPDEDWPF